MNLPGKKSLCKAFAIAACAVGMTGCAIVPMDPYYPAPVVVVPAPIIVPGPVIYGPVYPRGHYHPRPLPPRYYNPGHGHRY